MLTTVFSALDVKEERGQRAYRDFRTKVTDILNMDRAAFVRLLTFDRECVELPEYRDQRVNALVLCCALLIATVTGLLQTQTKNGSGMAAGVNLQTIEPCTTPYPLPAVSMTHTSWGQSTRLGTNMPRVSIDTENDTN